MTALFFFCPDCHEPVVVKCAILEEATVMLVAECDPCNTQIRLSCDSLTARFFEANWVKGNGKVN